MPVNEEKNERFKCDYIYVAYNVVDQVEISQLNIKE